MKRERKSTDGTHRGLSRREIVGGSTALAAAGWMGGRVQAASGSPGSLRRSAGDVYVQIFLRGAMDGLTTLVPHADDDYYAARPTLAVPKPGQANGALDLDGFFGLAPAAAPLLTPYSNGHLALVHASGSTDPTRSHFDGFTRMEFGGPNLAPGAVVDGWLARALRQTARPSVLRAIGAGDILPKTLAGSPRTLPIPDFQAFAFPGNPATAAERGLLLAQMHTAQEPPVGPAAQDTFAAIALLAQVDFAGYVPTGGALYPSSGLGKQLRDSAALIKSGLGVEAITIDYGGWDHHAGQGPLTGTMAYLLDDLTRSIEAFYLDMLPRIGQLVLVVQTEFGRRVAENSSQGTDHGHGGVMMVLGGGIAGGRVLSNWPGLAPAQLDEGDLAVTIDYRDILGEILDRRLGVPDLTQVFPQHTFTTHGITI